MSSASENAAPIDQADGIVAAIQRLAESDVDLRSRIETHPPGAVLMREGEENHHLYVLLEGLVVLSKHSADGEIPISEHGPGDLLGVNSYATGKRSFCTGKVQSFCSFLRLDEALVSRLPSVSPELRVLIDRLIVVNLAGRYRKAVRLQLELSAANHELTETRNRLIHQEKLATLGQLVAGLAHELNNPAAAMLRACEHLGERLEAIFQQSDPAGGWRAAWQAGATPTPGASREHRRVMEEITRAHPTAPRAWLRRLSTAPAPLRAQLLDQLSPDGPSPRDAQILDIFDAAALLHTLRVGAGQVTHLVEGLKNYARPSQTRTGRVALRENISDSLVILGNLLRSHPLEFEVAESLEVQGRPGDLGQIWTNLIKNACEAGPDGAPIRIEATAMDSVVLVHIIDHGPGIPPALHDRIFELNYTTKAGDEHFGLGLGLSITSSLVAQMNGSLSLTDTPGGGATFSVTLPAAV